MNPFTLLAIAAALAMDAFAVALAAAFALGAPSGRQTFRLALYFGLFQFVMPVAGWLAGKGLVVHIGAFDHWAAFGLLSFIGAKMLHESSVRGREDGRGAVDPTRGISLVMLSVATSIDALAVGLSLGLMRVRILFPALVIGAVAFLFTAAGMKIGPRAGRLLGKRVEVAGGVLLFLIGAKILFDHLTGQGGA